MLGRDDGIDVANLADNAIDKNTNGVDDSQSKYIFRQAACLKLFECIASIVRTQHVYRIPRKDKEPMRARERGLEEERTKERKSERAREIKSAAYC